MRTTPPAAMPAFRGFEESSSDGVVNFQICIYISPHFPSIYPLSNLYNLKWTNLDLIPSLFPSPSLDIDFIATLVFTTRCTINISIFKKSKQFVIKRIVYYLSIGASRGGNSNLRGTTKGCEMERLQEIDTWPGCNFVQPYRVGHLLGNGATMESSWDCH